MDFRLFAVFCLCMAVPMATGLNCYSCSGVSTGSVADTCVDASVGSITSLTCPTPLSGYESRCAFTSGEASVLGITSKYAFRACEDVATSTANTCTDTTDGSLFSGIGSFTGKKCYCASDKCNGQTTLVPTIITSLVGLTMALWAVL